MRAYTLIFTACVSLSLACSGTTVPVPQPHEPLRAGPPADITPTPAPKPSYPEIPKNGKYNGTGVVLETDPGQGTVSIDHQDIPDLMPGMKMEFFVRDKKALEGLAAGDHVDFVIEYKHPQETIVSIKKTK
jgi:Cu/Ag efflux protein CusF